MNTAHEPGCFTCCVATAQVVEVKGSYDQWVRVRKMERGSQEGTWVITAYLPPGVYQVTGCVQIPSLYPTCRRRLAVLSR